MLRQPALTPGHGTAQSESQTLLTQQRVTSIARAKTEDLQGVGLMGDDQLLRVTRPLNLEQMSEVLASKTTLPTSATPGWRG